MSYPPGLTMIPEHALDLASVDGRIRIVTWNWHPLPAVMVGRKAVVVTPCVDVDKLVCGLSVIGQLDSWLFC